MVARAFRSLRIFGRLAKDFIRQRAVSDVFPAIANCVTKLQVIYQGTCFLRKRRYISFLLQVMIKDRDMHQTMIARQSRQLLVDLVRGMWELMALLDLDEFETDTIIELMIDFVDFTSEVECLGENYEFLPLRRMDADILWLKKNCSKVGEEANASKQSEGTLQAGTH